MLQVFNGLLVDRLGNQPVVVAPSRSFNVTWAGLAGLPDDTMDRIQTVLVSSCRWPGGTLQTAASW